MELQLAGVFSETASLDLGVLEVEASRERNLPWLPWVAGGAIIAGAIMMVTGRGR
jgi:hypothetical protein